MGRRNQEALSERHAPYEDIVLQPEHWRPEVLLSAHIGVHDWHVRRSAWAQRFPQDDWKELLDWRSQVGRESKSGGAGLVIHLQRLKFR